MGYLVYGMIQKYLSKKRYLNLHEIRKSLLIHCIGKQFLNKKATQMCSLLFILKTFPLQNLAPVFLETLEFQSRLKMMFPFPLQLFPLR